MRFYFSGITSPREYGIIAQLLPHSPARLLADQFDMANIMAWPGNLAIDSGAWRSHREGPTLDPELYRAKIWSISRPIDFAIALDVVGDGEQTYDYWRQYFAEDHGRVKWVPVWQWDSNPDYLYAYLTVYKVPLIAIGGCVPWMHKPRRQPRHPMAEVNLRHLKDICMAYPQRFHILGLCWPEALRELAPYIASADTSHWLAQRSGVVMFFNTKGTFTQAPATVLPETKEMDPEDWNLFSARNLQTFVNTATPIYGYDVDARRRFNEFKETYHEVEQERQDGKLPPAPTQESARAAA